MADNQIAIDRPLDPISFYDGEAGRYASPANEAFYRRIADELLDFLPAGWQPRSVLEIGAGGGYATGVLRDRYPEAELLALEPAAAMRQAGRAVPGVEWSPQPLAGFSVCRRFDLVLASMSYHWLSAAERRKLVHLSAPEMLAMALPVSPRPPHQEGNRTLKQTLIQLRAPHRWPGATRKAERVLAEIQRTHGEVRSRIHTITEEYDGGRPLVAALQARGVLFALFGPEARAAERLLLERLPRRRPTTFQWAIMLVVAGRRLSPAGTSQTQAKNTRGTLRPTSPRSSSP